MRSSKYGSVMTDSMAAIASVTFNLPVIEISESAAGESNLEDEIEQQKDRSRCDHTLPALPGTSAVHPTRYT